MGAPNRISLPGVVGAVALTTALYAAQSGPQVDDTALEYGATGEWVSYNVDWKEQRYNGTTPLPNAPQ
jgi:hypothetical protein